MCDFGQVERVFVPGAMCNSWRGVGGSESVCFGYGYLAIGAASMRLSSFWRFGLLGTVTSL